MIVIFGSRRSGTSLLAKIIKDSGVSFGRYVESDEELEVKHKIVRKYRGVGYLENRMIIHAATFFKQASRIKPSIFIIERFKNFLIRIGNYLLRKGLKDASAFKNPCLNNHVGQVVYLGYEPIIIGVWRDPSDCLVSTHMQSPKYNYDLAIDYWTESNKNLLLYLNIYKGMLISFDDLIKGCIDTKKLSELIGVDEDIIISSVKKNIHARKHNKSKKKMYLPREVIELKKKLEEYK